VKKEITVSVLSALSIVVGFCLFIYNPDHDAISIKDSEILVIRTIGVLLILAGMIIPAICHAHRNQKPK